MKLQIQGQLWRLRIDEDELQRLRDGDVLASASILPGDLALRFLLRCFPETQARVTRDDDVWKIALPQSTVEAYAGKLPSRDGIDFTLPADAGGVFRLLFEVDVRDSMRRRSAINRPR